MAEETRRLPVTGAWRPGDPPGNRRFLTIATDHPFALGLHALQRALHRLEPRPDAPVDLRFSHEELPPAL